MLHQSLEELLETKPFEKISVGDIAEQATVNRATFYDHYPDKFALLEGMAAHRFQELLNDRQVVFDGTCPTAIAAMVLAMCDYLAGMPGRDCRNRRELEKYFESALMAVVRNAILRGLSLHSAATSPELLAATISGAIYGAVTEWLRTANRTPAEEIVPSIVALVRPLLRA
jgi:AcrR family transcriptional regulator